MHKQVNVTLGREQEFTFHVPAEQKLAPDEARQWLDGQFVALGCEPLRASGKVLIVDKVLVVTEAAGAKLLGDAQWAAQYALAVASALGKPMICVDVPAMAVTY
jgi:hypothetical protein